MSDSSIQVLSVLLCIILVFIVTWLVLSYYSEDTVDSSYYLILYISL